MILYIPFDVCFNFILSNYNNYYYWAYSNGFIRFQMNKFDSLIQLQGKLETLQQCYKLLIPLTKEVLSCRIDIMNELNNVEQGFIFNFTNLDDVNKYRKLLKPL